MNKKLIRLLIICTTLLAIILTGCGAQEAPKTDDPQGEAPKVEPIELRLHHQDPPTGAIGKGFDEWVKEVSEKTDGIVNITVYPSGTLGPGPKGFELTQDGVADIAWGSVGLYPSRFPLTDTMLLPMQGLNSGRQASKVAWEFYNSSDAVQKEWEDSKVKLISLYASGYSPIGLGKEIKTIDDFKGQKIRVIAGGPAELLKRMDAVPTIMPPMEVHQQVEKKVLDGWTIDWQAVLPFRLYEVSPFIHEFPNLNYYVSTHFIVMNKDAYNRIPDTYKPIFDSLTGEYLATLMGDQFDSFVEPGRKATVDYKHTMVEFPAEVEAQAKVLADAIAEDHAKQLDSEGKPGTETLQLLRDLTEKYKD